MSLDTHQATPSSPPVRLQTGAEGYQYLNVGTGWPSVRSEWLSGLIFGGENHAMQLAAMPGNAVSIGPVLPGIDPPLGGIAGMAVDRDNNIYLADPASDLIVRVDACDGRSSPLRCIGGSGSEVGRLRMPRGLAIGSRGWLYVADSGNHRIEVVDLNALQIRAVWGQPDPTATFDPGADPGRFNDPWDVVADSAGGIYVADRGNGRVQKFDANGRVDVAFWETVQAQDVAPTEPMSLATITLGTVELIVVVDGPDGRVLAYRLDGTFDADATALWQAAGTGITSVAQAGDLLLAGDSGGIVHVIAVDGTLRGSVAPFASAGAIVDLAVDCHGMVLVREMAGSILRLEPRAAYARCGTFLAGPLAVGSLPALWQRISAVGPELPDGSSLQLFTLSSDTFDGASPATTPEPPVSCSGPAITSAVVPEAETLVPLDSWRAAPANGFDFLALNEPGRYFWAAGVLRGTGAETPRLDQLRVEFNHESWMQHLPAVYRRRDASPSFGDPAMLLLESMFDDLEGKIGALPRLFDPFAAPDDTPVDSWLDWLAGWVGLQLEEDWPEEKRRQAVALAFGAHARRGTVESLRDLVQLYTGASVHISEPALTASIWSLGETSTLGGDTMLASAHPDGAIIGTTSTLGQSHLISDDEYGAPLFDSISHRFCVSAYALDLPDEAAAERIRAVIDREKPAHTTYELCTIGPLMRVGFQSQIGLDTIIGDVAGAFVPEGDALLGLGTVLPALPPDAPAMVGRTTSLTGAVTIV